MLRCFHYSDPTMTHRNYTDKQQVEEFDGDWDDLVLPEEYLEILDRKRFNQSMGKPAWDGIQIKRKE